MKKLWSALSILFFASAVFGAAVPTTGMITTSNCSSIPNPVANQTWCLLTTDGQIYVYNGSGYTQITGQAGGSVTSVGALGTANQITVTGASPITTSGSWTFSIPTNPTLPGTTTGTFSGNLTGTASGNLTSATGVTSVSKNGSAALVGAVTLTGGTNVTLTQAGQDISIAAAGSSGGCATTGSELLKGDGAGGCANAAAAANSKLLGSGAAGSGSPYSELTLGTNLSMSGTTLNAAGSGTVTSVAQSFTGGLISVAGSPVTTSGTLALTVAGTSGGIPYFSSGSTWASSGALTANLPVIGGGAGNPPTVGTRSGNTTAFVTTTGTQTSGDCVKIDANGNHIANGSACGSGTVTGSGTAGQVTYWSGTSAITSSSKLTWDNSGEQLGVNVSPTAFYTVTIGPGGGGTSSGINLLSTSGTVSAIFNANLGSTIVQVGAISNHPLVFYSNAAERARFSATGTLDFPNDMGFNAAAVSGRTLTITGLNNGTQFGTAALQLNSFDGNAKLLLNANNTTEGQIATLTNLPLNFYTNSTSRMQITAAGQVTIVALKTTGSATGKTVVCVDTSTGQLYASTSGVACAN